MDIQKLKYHSPIECEENDCNFWTDGKLVYYQRNNIPLKNANHINMYVYGDYAYDDKRVFLHNKLLRSVSPRGFEILNHSFVKTDSHIITVDGCVRLQEDSIVEPLDSGLWYGDSRMRGRGYIRVDNNVWYYSHWNDGLTKLVNVNVDNFISLQDGVMGLDDKRVYAFGKIVAGASATNFHKVIDSIYCGYYISNGKLFYENTAICKASMDMIQIPEELIEEKRIIDLIVYNNRYYHGSYEVSSDLFEKWLKHSKYSNNKA